MRFSERLGFKPAKLDLPVEKIDPALRNALWDVVLQLLMSETTSKYESWAYNTNFKFTLKKVWRQYLKQPIDTIPRFPADGLDSVRKIFMDAVFPDFYDLLEVLSDQYTDLYSNEIFQKWCNNSFEKEKAALRFIDGKLAPISSESEVNEVNSAVDQEFSSAVSQHISRAIEHYSDRTSPDYRNSIKEAISAVEAAARQVLNEEKATLGAALKRLETQGQLHSALKNGFSSLYGWTNDAEGIRHALLSEDNLTEEDARFMLVSCSAFANYLLSKAQ